MILRWFCNVYINKVERVSSIVCWCLALIVGPLFIYTNNNRVGVEFRSWSPVFEFLIYSVPSSFLELVFQLSICCTCPF